MPRGKARNRFDIQVVWPDGAISRIESRKDVELTIGDVAHALEEMAGRIRECQEEMEAASKVAAVDPHATS